MARRTAEPGSISHGTMRPEDLIPCFLSALEDLETYASHLKTLEVGRSMLVLNDNGSLMLDDTDYYIARPNEASEFLDTLFDALSEYAPRGHYFGSHPGDGSDYGFWPCDY